MYKKPLFNCEKSSLGWYQCHYCTVEKNIRIFLYNHLQNFHAKDKKDSFKSLCAKCYKCSECHFSTFSFLLLFKHNLTCPENKKESIAKNQCSYCLKKMFDSTGVKDHITRIHTAPEKIKWYKCDQCNYQGKVKENLRHHIKNRHKSDKKCYYCNHCEFTSMYKMNVKTHIETMHTARENLPKYECNICKYKSIRKGDLKMHTIRMHTPPKEIQWYQCEHCTYKSNTKDGLIHHVKRQHLPVLLLQCDYCEYKSKIKCHLQRHILAKHTARENLKKYECNTCEYKTIYKHSLQRHMQIHTVQKNMKSF